MPSKSRKAFDQNSKDVERLLSLHEQEGGKAPGRRYGLEVLNKSAIVLITAYWEAYCEDLAAEALEHIVKNSKTADSLPKHLKKLVAQELEEDSDELAVWRISDDKWKSFLLDRLEKLRNSRNWKLNTPKSGQIEVLFLEAIGLKSVSDSWKWSKKMTCTRAKNKLNRFVSLRGSIAHRGKSVKGVTKAEVQDYFGFIQQLAGKTGMKVNTHVKQTTGKPLWRRTLKKRRATLEK